MKHETDDDKRIEALIRSAGRRPTIPAADLDALRETADLHWQRLVAAERRRKRRAQTAYALAASLAVALIGAGWWLDRDAPAGAAPERVVVATTDSGEALPSGTRLDVDAPVAVRTAGGSSVRLDRGTSLRLVSRTRLELDRGAVYVDSGPSSAEGTALEIRTPSGVVREIGTQYEVRILAEAVIVRVREGRVALDRQGPTEFAGRGESLTIRHDGTVERGTVSPSGPEWSWVLDLAPAFALEGRTLDLYLDWIARETGWRVSYADEALARSARTIQLHGTIQGLRPDESLDVVLPGARLDHRVEGDTVWIFRSDS